MADKTITLNISGDEAFVDSGLDSFVRESGWSEQSINENGDPISQIDFAKEILSEYFRSKVSKHNAKQAALTAENAARQASDAALDAIIMTASIE